uniref:Uncharacterized protein n=1 Tax=Candidatus Kentrum sp. DK TaxID=2126562 RepID=A0A450SKE0_9GAMM|nr:MAG: hypothetical protein BECKDK2373B_GA0170837_104428 [Candidatus Kentron sp. DK]
MAADITEEEVDRNRVAIDNSCAAIATTEKAIAITEKAAANKEKTVARSSVSAANSGAAIADSGCPVAAGEGKSPPIERQWPPALGGAASHGSAMVTDETLAPKEKAIHQQGLVSVLRQLHDELDRAVFDAYGWNDIGERLVGRPGATTPWPEKPGGQLDAEEELLQRLVDLNQQRAAEEQKGIIRWLRPQYQNSHQNPQGTAAGDGQGEICLDTPAAPMETDTDTTTAKTPWPKTLAEQVQIIRAALAQYPQPASAEQLAKGFMGAQRKRVSEILETLVAMGQAREEGGRYAG